MWGGDHMCCNTGSHHGSERWGHPGVCFCGCDDAINFRPRFITKAQKINRLKQYLEDLKNEAKAVEEQIAQIKKDK